MPRRRVSKHNAETLNRSHPFSCSVGRSSTAFTVELPILDCAMRHALSPILSKEHYISCLQIQRFECERALTQTTQTSARSFRYSDAFRTEKSKVRIPLHRIHNHTIRHSHWVEWYAWVLVTSSSATQSKNHFLQPHSSNSFQLQ